jgi:hypothetical protein
MVDDLYKKELEYRAQNRLNRIRATNLLRVLIGLKIISLGQAAYSDGIAVKLHMYWRNIFREEIKQEESNRVRIKV